MMDAELLDGPPHNPASFPCLSNDIGTGEEWIDALLCIYLGILVVVLWSLPAARKKKGTADVYCDNNIVLVSFA